jgi:hypothetical protein
MVAVFVTPGVARSPAVKAFQNTHDLYALPPPNVDQVSEDKEVMAPLVSVTVGVLPVVSEQILTISMSPATAPVIV